MKKVFVILGVFIGISGFSQEEKQEMETLFGSEKTHFGVFLELSGKNVWVNDQPGIMVGGKFSAVLGNAINLGFGGYGLSTKIRSNQIDQNGNLLDYAFGYGGMIIEPVIGNRKAIHFTFPILLGAGGVTYFHYPSWNGNNWDWNTPEEFGSFLIAEPGVNVELNLLKWMRLSSGASWRFVSSSPFSGVSTSGLNGLSFNIGLRMGWF